MLISRQVGTVSSIITVFLPNRTVSTGAGLANIVASTVRLTWLRNDQAAVSSWTLTSGTLGTWAASTMTQVGSTSTLGAYQFGLPDGLFVSGDNAYVHIMSSTATFAEVPIVIELTKDDNQQYTSSKIFSSTNTFLRINSPVTVSSGVVSVSAATIPFSVSSVTAPVGVSTLPAITSMTVAVNVSSIYGSAAVTTAAGVFSAGVSSVTGTVGAVVAPVGVSTLPAVTTITTAVNVSSIYGSAAVTSAAGVWAIGDVTSFTAGALGQFFTTDAGDYSTSVLGSVVQEIADNVSATVGAQVGVSSISIPVSVSSVTAAVNVSAFHGSALVTSAAGVLGPLAVSSLTTPVTVSAGTVRVSSATIPFGVSTLTGSAISSFFLTPSGLEFADSVASTVVFEIASNATATISGDVGVSSISTPVTVSSGVVAVSTITIPVGVSSGSVAVTSATAAVYEAAADALLGRNVGGGSNTGRIVKEAFYAIRNRVDLTNGIVYATDDTTSSWAFTTSTSNVDPVVEIDPA